MASSKKNKVQGPDPKYLLMTYNNNLKVETELAKVKGAFNQEEDQALIAVLNETIRSLEFVHKMNLSQTPYPTMAGLRQKLIDLGLVRDGR